MMRTPLCDVLGIEVPIICAPFGPWEQVELAAAVCEAGGLVGTRFLASTEAAVAPGWKQAIVDAAPQDAVKLAFTDAVLPPLSPGGHPATPRVLRTPFVDRWNADPGGAAAESARLRAEVLDALAAGRLHEYLPFTGQSAALVHDVRPVQEIVERVMAEASEALEGALRRLPL